MISRLLLLLVFSLINAYRLFALDYYVSNKGNDRNNGTSTSTAWQSISKINKTIFRPGDKILFAGGETFTGSLTFSADSKGTPAKPIYIGSYGSGRANISSGNSAGLYAYNTAGYKIANLNFTGSGSTTNTGSGIYFYLDLATTKLEHIVVDSVEVQGYKSFGILIGSWKLTSGFQNVSITNSVVHEIGNIGIGSFSEVLNAHSNFYVGRNKVFDISGLPEKTTTNTGSGIVLAGIDGALIEYCEAYNTGWLNACKEGGPVGIWGYMCNNLVIQYNESHHNRTGTAKDGGGFDLDGGCTNSIMQYNYSHDNEGAGFLIAQYQGAPPLQGITIRFNISENDGRKNGYGGIHLWSSGSNGGIQNVEIYNNTLYLTPSATGNPKGGIHVQSSGMKNINIRNNIIQTTGGIPLVHAVTTSGIKFEGNNYWSTGREFLILADNGTHSHLDSWRKTGQEMLNGHPTGYALNPELTEPGKGTNLPEPISTSFLTQYHLNKTSPMIERGLILSTNYKIDPGKFDFFGNPLSQSAIPSIGAHQVLYNNPWQGSITGASPSVFFVVEAYPNPAIDFLEIKISGGVQVIKVQLYDSAGNLVLAQQGQGGELRVDVSSLLRGMYLLKIDSPKGSLNRKIILSR